MHAMWLHVVWSTVMCVLLMLCVCAGVWPCGERGCIFVYMQAMVLLDPPIFECDSWSKLEDHNAVTK